MTREEAIDILRSYLMFDKSNMQIDMALNMAIEALHHVEAEEKGYCHRIIPSNVEAVVRCKECRHHGMRDCPVWGDDTTEDYMWCYYGERSEAKNE